MLLHMGGSTHTIHTNVHSTVKAKAESLLMAGLMIEVVVVDAREVEVVVHVHIHDVDRLS